MKRLYGEYETEEQAAKNKKSSAGDLEMEEKIKFDKVIERAKELVLALQDFSVPCGYVKITVEQRGFWFSSFTPVEKD